ncbi:glycine--tRNA ligase subunit beta [Dongia rigui]|uniref:Glycine--tRNA ligase beta subunit n=1 Tax=Dongia rigui TaxID=940149 RepID=A0ABU5DZH7_9PROT|nr:glycine--tRNA ligase subunit beta [Dongia rigui]MDY0872723.1 glycine--tRNA ligase subunit beta [Dongia rigui]
MAELLLELFSEEIPARMQARAADDLQRLVTDKLKAAGLTFTSAKSFVTPRRLALVIEGLPLAQPDVKEEKKGPRVGSPQQAVDGFLKSAGLTSLDACEKRDTGKGEFYFAVVEKKGVTTSAVIDSLIDSVLMEFPWPKSMRWAGNDFRWVRPLHSIVLLFDGKKSSRTEFELGTTQNKSRERIQIGDKTKGHRFLSSGELTVTSFADYQAKLKAAKVILDQAERRAEIKRQADAVAAKEGLSVKQDDGLLDEVTGLVEWPTVLIGKIDDEFMSVPHEVLTTSMRVNQKYFALLDKSGKLAPRFLVTANIEASDGGAAIVHGNERVLRARLSDAKFFWDQDLKVSLAERTPLLDAITYHAKLGSVGQKVSRVKALARDLAKFIPSCDAGLANQAAGLAKADLVSGMVGEFPELQGIMGRYYARHEKLPDAVADAIADHYKPLGPNDTCPIAPVSVAVALADKIDTLTGFFAVDEKPTGSKDPFALRRAALGIIRLILENKLRLKLRDVLGLAYSGYYDSVGGFEKSAPKAVINDLMDFFADRLKVALKEQGARHDLISAVFALGNEDDLTRLLARVDALKGLVDSADGANLLAGYKRATNILRIEEKKDGRAHSDPPDKSWLKLDEEKSLYQALDVVKHWVDEAIGKEDFASAMAKLSTLREPVDAFFDKVTVNADEKELRGNRLRLLNSIRSTFNLVADFSKIEG